MYLNDPDADWTSVESPRRDGTRRYARELHNNDADEIMTVWHADIEGEYRDIEARLEVPMHKAQNAREVLDTGDVLNEGVAYENVQSATMRDCRDCKCGTTHRTVGLNGVTTLLSIVVPPNAKLDAFESMTLYVPPR